MFQELVGSMCLAMAVAAHDRGAEGFNALPLEERSRLVDAQRKVLKVGIVELAQCLANQIDV